MEGPVWSKCESASLQHFSNGALSYALTFNQSHHQNQEWLDLKEWEL